MPARRAPAPRVGLREAGWLLLAVLVPLWLNPWAAQPFEPSKVVLARSLIWLLAGLWLASYLRDRRSPWQALRANPLRWPLLALAGALGLATLFAVDRGQSLWGSYERGQGLLTLLSYLVLFVVVADGLRCRAQARRLTLALALTGLPLVALGLAQALGWDYGPWLSDARSPVRATLGRANFLGVYLAMLLPLTLALGLTTPRRERRLAYLALALAEALTLGLTQARGAWLAGGVALAAFALLWAWPGLAPRWRVAAVAGGLAAVVAALGLAWRLGGEGGSTAARLAIWQATWQLVQARPLLGYGPDALGLVFPQVFPPQLVYYQGRGVFVDRAHNLLLDWAVTAGAVGLLAWLAVLGAFCVLCWRALARELDREGRTLLAAGLAAVLANQAGNMVGFDVTATAVAGWLLLALGVALAGGEREAPPLGAPTGGSPALRWLSAALALAIALVAVFQFNLRPAAAEVAARSAAEQAGVGNWEGAAWAGAEAVAWWPGEPSYHQSLSWAYLQRTRDAGDKAPAWLAQAEGELLVARDLRPGDFRVWWALGEFYATWGGLFDPGRLSLADRAYERAVALAPNSAQIYTAWAAVDLAAHRPADAVAKARHATALDATDASAFARLGDAEAAAGNPQAASDAYGLALSLSPSLTQARLGLAYANWQLGRVQSAREALAEVLRVDPANPAALDLRRQMGP